MKQTYGVYPNTRIETNRGKILVGKLEKGERIFRGLTGYTSVISLGIIYYNSYLIGIKADGKELISTPDQRIMADNDWTYMGRVKVGDKVMMSDGELHDVTSVEVRFHTSNPAIVRVRLSDSNMMIANNFIVEC